MSTKNGESRPQQILLFVVIALVVGMIVITSWAINRAHEDDVRDLQRDALTEGWSKSTRWEPNEKFTFTGNYREIHRYLYHLEVKRASDGALFHILAPWTPETDQQVCLSELSYDENPILPQKILVWCWCE